MFIFESQHINTDVTAVKILRNHYLIGVGGYLHVFDRSCKLIRKINVFEGQKIYNVVPNIQENKILIYGGKYLTIITVVENFIQVSQSAVKCAPDWILAAKWIDSNQQIATVSMHNRLQIWSTTLELLTEIICEEKCILYSAFICYDKFNELVILSGTVFSEVLLWKLNKDIDSRVLKRLQKHKGVIFSVHYNETSGYICSSSDDRSTVVWKPKNKNLSVELEQQNIEINATCHVFGHLSRVFRCMSLEKCFLSAGEDSVLNIWSFDGKLIRKIETHQGGPIWTIDANENENKIFTGGSDCGATLFPLTCNFEEQLLSLPNRDVPKSIGCLINDNLVVFSESGALYHFLSKEQKWLHIQTHLDLRSYALLTVSKCRNLVALAGFHGQIYIYKQNNNKLQNIVTSQTKLKSRIFSMHWLDCKTFLVCQSEGHITLFFLRNGEIQRITSFILPPSKERWSTCAIFAKEKIVIGDRKGNIHLFAFGKLEPVQTLRRAHSHLGVTKLIKREDTVISLGRNSLKKTFAFNNDTMQLISSTKLPFTWLVDVIEDLLLAFSGDKFILWNHKTNRVIFETSCGGGHRSWDFTETNNNVLFSYIKDKIVHYINFDLNNFSAIDLIEGYQVKEINSVEAIKVFNTYVIISGGEDITLRVNMVNDINFLSLISLKPHLSSIRTITSYKINQSSDTCKETYLVFSGGGRAQIICWQLDVLTEKNCFKDVICSEQHSYYKISNHEESEMRIMNLTVINIQNQLLLLAACSDGNVKVFLIEINNFGKYNLRFYQDMFYKLKCIIKLCSMIVFSKEVLVTMATDGKLVFWDISNILKHDKTKYFDTIQCHQSGINSYAFKIIREGFCLFLTGGDDNAIVLNLIRFQNLNSLSLKNVDAFNDSDTHCAQITGVFLSDKYFLTASIDQRIAVFQWKIINEKIVCQYVSKYNTAVADLQGLCCFESNDYDVFVYGKGIEYIKIKKKP